MNVFLVVSLKSLYAFYICVHCFEFCSASFCRSFQTLQLFSLSLRFVVCLSKLIESYPKQYTIEENNFSEPIYSFVECSIVVKFLYCSETSLLNNYPIHCHLKTIEELAQPTEEEISTTVFLAIHVLEVTCDCIVDWSHQEPDSC